MMGNRKREEMDLRRAGAQESVKGMGRGRVVWHSMFNGQTAAQATTSLRVVLRCQTTPHFPPFPPPVLSENMCRKKRDDVYVYLFAPSTALHTTPLPHLALPKAS